METRIPPLIALLRTAFLSRTNLALENAALSQQLTVYQRTRPRTRPRNGDRLFGIILRRLWSGWDRSLIVVKPETVISGHSLGARLFWLRRSKSGKVGRPRIPQTHIAFIRRISSDHPEWGEDKIAEELEAKFGVHHSGSAIRRYMIVRRPPRAGQTWRTFIQNHAKEAWVKQQVREATASGQTPRFLVHDNDGIFGQFGRRITVEGNGRKRSYRCHLDRWLGEVIGIDGLPIPYEAPTASPHVERFMRTLRNEALDHFIFLGADHIRRVVCEFISYYIGARPSQAIHAIPDPFPELREPPPAAGRLVTLPVLGGLTHDYRLAA